ncbi:Peptide methionine sulfoxide reductase msrA [Giardia muris]|uniref:peptide-methionine (S)-S-oxide reductase n=1 Tax=Giardia muris TaxID=5742 RepID=A0A3S7RNE5_GIAMU|nr:Peptide methionine sulfoxide reductase msrA [Giardia muris]TNJ27734.1 Peptide methionine sulfoxide reductase msrA [Giardia muris]|eukprot:TNJ27734.1 Peptide methionine sulfoxide reductase msrA [Giardia muris]
MARIVFGGGCFWGVQAFFNSFRGILSTVVGYANADQPFESLSYQEVCTGTTGAVEVIDIRYDPSVITLLDLLDAFFGIIDPTTRNQQGHDVGLQYRTGIYYTDPHDLQTIIRKVGEVVERYPQGVATEVRPLVNFYPAEEYHQCYLDKNPEGYCHIDVSKAHQRFAHLLKG